MADISEANRKHWDKMAHEYDIKPWQKKMIGYISEQLVEKRDFFGLPKNKGEEFKMLDYASGPGTVSAALHPYTTSILALDLSENMIKEYKSRFPQSHMTALHSNLLASPPWITDPSSPTKNLGPETIEKDPRFNDFDAVIVGLGFHHFENWAQALQTLSKRVKKGGVVGIIDILPHGDAFPEDMRAMMHKSGFTEQEMQQYMEEAGLVDVAFLPLEENVVMKIKDKDVEKEMFFARGRRE